jgi:hypothetical protein
MSLAIVVSFVQLQPSCSACDWSVSRFLEPGLVPGRAFPGL